MSEYKLYKVTVKDTYLKFKKVKPIYVIQKDKDSAIRYVQNHLKDNNHMAMSASYLGEQLAQYMYHSDKK